MHGEELSEGGVDAVVPRTTVVAFSPCRLDVGSTPNTRGPCLWLACPITLGRSVISRGDAHLTGVLHAGVAGQVEDGLTVLLEDLAGKYLGEKIRFVLVSRHVDDVDATGSAQLAHLEELPVDVA